MVSSLGEAVMNTARIDRGRLPGTRITVYDVFYYLEAGRQPAEVAEILGLSPDQVALALRYIEENRQAVQAVHQRIEERNARGNPPEIQAKLEASRAKVQAWLAERQQQKGQEANGEGHPGGR